MQTRTGSFPIGFRRGWGDWQRDLGSMIAWAKDNGFGVVDLGRDADTLTAQVVAAGLKVGSADLADWEGLITADDARRAEGLAKNTDYIAACAAQGIQNYFLVMLPQEPDKPRKDNFALMLKGLEGLIPVLEKYNGRLVIEGWPGRGALCCTPEGYRAVIKETGSKTVGINYDPSHLIRMGIDPIQFLEEFASSVYHVHGKDTELIAEALYEYGTEQPATFAAPHWCGAHHWRYTIPGHGVTRWTPALTILQKAGYQGAVCIELEDENFTGSDAAEQAGIMAGGLFLSYA